MKQLEIGSNWLKSQVGGWFLVLLAFGLIQCFEGVFFDDFTKEILYKGFGNVWESQNKFKLPRIEGFKT